MRKAAAIFHGAAATRLFSEARHRVTFIGLFPQQKQCVKGSLSIRVEYDQRPGLKRL